MQECFYYSDQKDTTLEKIAYAKQLYDAQVVKAEREEYIRDVLLQNYVDKVKDHMTKYDALRNELFSKAQAEIGARLKKDRPNLEHLKGFLMRDFLNNDKSFKLEKIISCGYENYCWRFEFRRNGTRCYIEIPIKRNLTTKNLEYAHYGMFVFGTIENDYIYQTFKGTYEMQELAGFIKDWTEGKVK